MTGVLDELRAGRAEVEQAMNTVAALMRPPNDPFHERLVAAYPQIRRFLPLLIEAIELQATDSAQPVLTAYHALGDWLTGKPRTTTLPEGDVPLEVINASWEPHVRDRDAGTVNRAGYASACSMRYAPGCAAATSTPRPAPAGAILAPNSWPPANGRRNARPSATNSA